MQEMIPLGISVAGGCCGTTPEHIKALIENAMVCSREDAAAVI